MRPPPIQLLKDCSLRCLSISLLLLDILPFLSRMSEVFQTDSADFSKIQPIVDCRDALLDLNESPGMYVESSAECVEVESDKVLYKRDVIECSKEAVDESIRVNLEGFEGFSQESESQVCDVEITYRQQKGVLSRVMSEYVDAIVGNLSDRFSERDIVSKFSVFIMSYIVKAEKEGSQTFFFKYGLDEVNFIFDKFEKHHGIEIDCCMSEYHQYKRLVCMNFFNVSFSSCVESILSKSLTDK